MELQEQTKLEEYSAEWVNFHETRLMLKGMIKWLARAQRRARRRLRNYRTEWKSNNLGISNKYKCIRDIERRREIISSLHEQYNELRGRPAGQHTKK